MQTIKIPFFENPWITLTGSDEIIYVIAVLIDYAGHCRFIGNFFSKYNNESFAFNSSFIDTKYKILYKDVLISDDFEFSKESSEVKYIYFSQEFLSVETDKSYEYLGKGFKKTGAGFSI